MSEIVLRPIGTVHTPYGDKVSAPRQGVVSDAEGTIVLEPGHGYEHALEDLEGWDYLWVLYWFSQVEGFRSKVLPPRSEKRRGLFSTRAPHRPNPIGLSAVRLLAVDGLTVHVRGVDMIDGTPVLDLKPYVPYADSFPNARTGWLEAQPGELRGERPPDPDPGWIVGWSSRAAEQVSFLDARGLGLRQRIDATLALGPRPHPYRRIRQEGDGLVLAVQSWRVRFHVEAREVTVEEIRSGYRPSQLPDLAGEEGDLHRAFVDGAWKPRDVLCSVYIMFP
jgi:tRNA (adenine37-N6)-methyltransferase